MARVGLFEHRKFKRLVRDVGGKALALGSLELIWQSSYATADPYIGDAIDVEAVAEWQGEAGKLLAALLSAGFIDHDEERGGYVVHDLYDHCPNHVRDRAKREAAREQTGQTISDVRREAGKKGAIAKQARSNQEASASQLPANEKQFAGVGLGEARRGEETLPPNKSGGSGDNGSPAPRKRGRPPTSERDPMPFTIAEAMQLVAHAVLVDPFPAEPKFTANLTRLIRQYPDPATWRRIAAWLADGGDGWNTERRGKPDLGIFVARFGGWMQQSAATVPTGSATSLLPPPTEESGFSPLLLALVDGRKEAPRG